MKRQSPRAKSALTAATGAALGAAVALTAAFAQPAAAGDRHRDGAYRGGPYTHVTARSLFGNGSITAPVRPTWYGYEVRLPGGTWWDCSGNCSEMLRRQTVDFWEEDSGGPGTRLRDLLR